LPPQKKVTRFPPRAQSILQTALIHPTTSLQTKKPFPRTKISFSRLIDSSLHALAGPPPATMSDAAPPLTRRQGHKDARDKRNGHNRLHGGAGTRAAEARAARGGGGGHGAAGGAASGGRGGGGGGGGCGAAGARGDVR
jgi:hypothetical protein